MRHVGTRQGTSVPPIVATRQMRRAINASGVKKRELFRSLYVKYFKRIFFLEMLKKYSEKVVRAVSSPK
jgi:hypothetical protein